MTRGTDAAHEVVAEIAADFNSRLRETTDVVMDTLSLHIPELLEAENGGDLLLSSTQENIETALRMLQRGGPFDSVIAPEAAQTWARRLAQRDVPATRLIQAYRAGQNRFLQAFVLQVIERSPEGEHVEGLACLEAVETVTTYVDEVLDQVLTTYAEARDGWMQDRSAVLAMRVKELLSGLDVDVSATERALDYRLDEHRHHVGAILWTPDLVGPIGLETLRSVVRSVQDRLGVVAPLVVPEDEATAWVWFSTDRSLTANGLLAEVLASEPGVAASVGEPGCGLEGFRRTHQQALSARCVAISAGECQEILTPFVEVAPLTMLCADLASARSWIWETLGGLAYDTERNAGLRETALVFLQAGGSYTAAADQLFLHRNTAQYRIRKAETERGRSLREGRLDVEIALLACKWMGEAVLRPAA